jgi:hypothetical protein
MGKRKEDKGRQPPWISVFRHTWKSAAWKALSFGARALYVELAANYNTKMMNSVFMSARTGAKQLNTSKDSITLWLRELEHYDFLVKVSGPFLGLDGEGKSAHYRFTDRWYGNKEPTYDFQNWDGVMFEPPKRADKRGTARFDAIKKQNPVRASRTPRPTPSDIGVVLKFVQNGNKRPTPTDIGGGSDCPTPTDITSFNHILETSLPTYAPYDWAEEYATVFRRPMELAA